jgi:hypothetical protein
MSPRKLFFVLGAIFLCTVVAFGQSSGSFNYGTQGGSTGCVVNNNNGSITGGAQCSLSVFNGQANCGATGQPPCTGSGDQTACIGDVKTTIKTSSGNGNVFVVRPSAVIGLLTDATVSKNSTTSVGSSSAFAGVDVGVMVTPLSGQAKPTVTPGYPITYDARFIQISTNLFDVLATTCTATTTGCFITFNESTVSAHSFDFVVTGLQAGNYGLEAGWTSSLGDFGIANSMTCVGPMNLTVEQNKIFQPSTGISF